MKRRVFVWTTFNAWTPNLARYDAAGLVHPALRKEWIARRFNTWKATAYQSIVRQSYPDWIYLVRCHVKTKAICDKLFCGLDSRIIPVYYDTEKQLLGKLVGDCKQVLAVRLDSDDCYHPDALLDAVTWANSAKSEYAYWLRGYAFDTESGTIFKYEVRTSGPFFCHLWRADDFLKHGRTQDSRRHNCIHRTKKATALPYRRFCVNVNHGLNDSTRPNKKRFVDVVSDINHRQTIGKLYGLQL